MTTIQTAIDWLKKVFTQNYCDTCGFTKDKVYVTEILIEGGIIQCDKCKTNKL